MLYLRLEMWPGGDKNQARLIGEMAIHRISPQEPPLPQDYGVRISAEGGGLKPEQDAARGVVFQHPYEKSVQNVWALVLKALQAARYLHGPKT